MNPAATHPVAGPAGSATTQQVQLPPGFMTNVPAGWQQQGAMQQTILSQCGSLSAPIQAGMNNILRGVASSISSGVSMPMCSYGAIVSLDMPAVCPGPSIPPDTSSLTCSRLLSSSDQGASELQQLKLQTDNAYCSVQCKQGKLLAIKTELNCLSQQMNSIGQSLFPLYQESIQSAQQWVLQSQQHENDLDTKSKNILERLNGAETGTPGLLKLQVQTQALFESMNSDIQNVSMQEQQFKQSEKNLSQTVQMRIAALTAHCFKNTPQSTYKCPNPAGNDPPYISATAEQYAVCAYKSSFYIGANSGSTARVERSKTHAADAGQEANTVQSVLGQIFANTPTDPKIPTTAEELRTQSQQSVFILEPRDLATNYGSQLNQLKNGKFNVGQFIQQAYAYCYQYSQKIVAKEQREPNTALHSLAFQMKQQQQMIQTGATGLLNKYNKQYSDVQSGLTGVASSLDISACVGSNVAVSTQVGCLRNVQNSMSQLLQGGGQPSNIQILGNFASGSRPITIQCSGLNACVSALQKTNQEVVSAKNTTVASRAAFIQAANQKISNATLGFAGSLNGLSANLNQNIDKMNAALASLGGGTSISFPPMKGQPLRQGKDGLFEVPQAQDLRSLIGSSSQPPLPDVNSSTIAQAMGGLSTTSSSYDQQLSTIMVARSTIENLKHDCVRQQVAQILNGISVESLQNCYVSELCDSDVAQQNLNSMNQALSRIKSSSDSNVSSQMSLTSLQTGVSSFCDKPGAMTEQKRQSLKEKIIETPGSFSSVNCRLFMSSLLDADKRITVLTRSSGHLGDKSSSAK